MNRDKPSVISERRTSRLPSTRRGELAYHFPSLSDAHEIFPKCHMFMEDVRNGLMPYARISRPNGFSVSVGEDPALVELLQSLTRHDRAYCHEELLCDAVNEIGLHLSWHGRAIYQITPDETDPRIIRLRSCTPRRLYKIPGFFLHHVPLADREEFSSRFLVVARANVWDLGMPSQLGGTTGYLRLLKELKRNKGTFPSFFLEDLNTQGTTPPQFESSEYIRRRKARETRITNMWGWNRRDSSLDHETEFFHYYRTITFRWAQAILRDHIIAELNVLLKRLQLTSQIAIGGIPTPTAILEIRRQMTEGHLSFEEAFKRTSVFALDE